MSTYTIPGAMTQNNLGISSIIKSDPNSEVRTYVGVPAVAKVFMEGIELVSEAQEGQLFNEVVAIMHSKITELACNAFPGAPSGSLTMIKFNPGSVVEHTIDDDFEVVEKEVEDLPTVNDAAPAYEMHYHFNREQLFTIAAKGGFVPGYADYAIPSNILRREWQSIPVMMDITEIVTGGVCPKCGRLLSAHEVLCPDCSTPGRMNSIFFFEIENSLCADVDMKSIGYNLPEYFLVSEEMKLNPDRVVGLEAEAAIDRPDYVSREEALENALEDLNEEMEGIAYDEAEVDGPDLDESELGESVDREDYHDPRETAYAGDSHRQQELDNIAIAAILNGRSAVEAVEEAQTQARAPKRYDFGGLDADSELDLDQDTEKQAGTDDVLAEDKSDKRDDDGMLDFSDDGPIDFSADIAGAADENVAFDERNLSEGERKARENLRTVGKEAIGDMLIDGASSIADAQTNANENQFGGDADLDF